MTGNNYNENCAERVCLLCRVVAVVHCCASADRVVGSLHDLLLVQARGKPLRWQRVTSTCVFSYASVMGWLCSSLDYFWRSGRTGCGKSDHMF